MYMHIFDYTDYRLFLRDFYEARKRQNSAFSLRFMGTRLGIDAGFLVKVMQGKFHLTPEVFPKVAKLCAFEPVECDYFEALVSFAKARSESDTKLYFEKLLAIKGPRAKRLTDLQYEYYQHWYHAAIRALLHYRAYTGAECKAIAAELTPTITAKDARESIALLRRLKLVEPDTDGFLRPTSALISAGEQIRVIAVRHFQRQTMQLAIDSLERHPKEIRDISTVTISIGETEFDLIREKIRECRESILQIAESTAIEDRICQLNIQLIPLTIPPGVVL